MLILKMLSKYEEITVIVLNMDASMDLSYPCDFFVKRMAVLSFVFQYVYYIYKEKIVALLVVELFHEIYPFCCSCKLQFVVLLYPEPD